jgi:hypothetical protein
MIKISIIALFLLKVAASGNAVYCQDPAPVTHDKVNKTITLRGGNGELIIRINYSEGCVLDQITVKGRLVTGNGNLVYSGIDPDGSMFSSKKCLEAPIVSINADSVIVGNIVFGSPAFLVKEQWAFKIAGNDIGWQINRQYKNNGVISGNCFPCWQFNTMQTWDGALLDNGGVAWNRFLNEPGDAYGVNTSTVTFWNRSENSCLRIASNDASADFRTATFSHLKNNTLSLVQSSSAEPVNTKFGLRRFIKTGDNVFSPIKIRQSRISRHYLIQALTYDREYDRGELRGIKEESVNEILNTIGRYGVVDKNLYGSNGWRTGWVVLQEPWFALFGLAINSPDFINGFSKALEFEKEHAVMPDGRVLPRWHHDSTDAMPNTFRPDGFYECMWGYMLDCQPAFAINVAEQFDLTGDTIWLRRFKSTCELVLDYMIKRDSDGNGLFEVIQKTHKEQKGTDWLDVVWASYEVSSINAYMYKALVRWSELEKLLGDQVMSGKYMSLAKGIKAAFNKSTANGGFWDEKNQWYVHWREPDGSYYGNNLVSMVNFLAFGYGLCDDPVRKEVVLSKMEELMQKENLFIWPACFYPYEENVGLSNVNYPYPNYENGDLFLSWAELGTRCYAEYKPETAVKYIRNVIDRYETGGLAYQRYTRINQSGAGDDILANNIMAVVGLYRNIYGIRPQYNRLYLEPHLTSELNGTKIKYLLRDQNYWIELNQNKNSISANNFTVSNKNPFAVDFNSGDLKYYNSNSTNCSLKISGSQSCTIDIVSWEDSNMHWNETGISMKKGVIHELYNLKPNAVYQLFVNNLSIKKYTSDNEGIIRFDLAIEAKAREIKIIRIITN